MSGMKKSKGYVVYSKEDEVSFLLGALMWRNSVKPKLLPHLVLASCYSFLLTFSLIEIAGMNSVFIFFFGGLPLVFARQNRFGAAVSVFDEKSGPFTFTQYLQHDHEQ